MPKKLVNIRLIENKYQQGVQNHMFASIESVASINEYNH